MPDSNWFPKLNFHLVGTNGEYFVDQLTHLDMYVAVCKRLVWFLQFTTFEKYTAIFCKYLVTKIWFLLSLQEK